MRNVLFRAAAVAALAAPAAAQEGIINTIDDTVTSLAGDATIIAGGGVGFVTQPYAGAEDGVRVFPIPMISYQAERFRFEGKTLSAQLYANDRFAVSAIADWRFQSYDAEDSPVLDGMDDRNGTLEAGVRVTKALGGVNLSGSALVDTLSRHGGYELNATASYELSDWRPLSVRPFAGLRYQSSSLADYYFGVDPEEATSLVCAAVQGTDCFSFDRPAYETGAAVVPTLGLSARQALSRKWAVYGLATYDFLPGEITDSPIVSEDGLLSTFVGVVYLFGNAADSVR